MAVNEQVKEAIDSLGRTFEEFKHTNDERLAQIELKDLRMLLLMKN